MTLRARNTDGYPFRQRAVGLAYLLPFTPAKFFQTFVSWHGTMAPMSKHLIPNVLAVLSGSPIRVEARKAGTHVEKLRRLVMAHPDYEAAKAAGKLHQRGLPGLVKAEFSPQQLEEAVNAVLSGESANSAGKRLGVPISTLCRHIRKAHPEVVLKGGKHAAVKRAEADLAKAAEALERAKRRLEELAA